MEDFQRSDMLQPPFMTVSGDMSSDKSSGRLCAAGAELRQPQPAKYFATRPRHLADRFRSQRDRRKVESDDFTPETFTLPLEAARRKVRDILDGIPRSGYLRTVERWRQLPDGLIEFTMRRLPTPD
jgi:hypothetical protein